MSMAACYQALAPWLCASFDRASRVYLETHLELLSEQIYQFLELFTSEHKDDPREDQHARTCLQLLRDTSIGGGTQEAVRAAYTNIFGGLLLDLPVWLLEIEQQLIDLSHFGCTDRMVASGKMQLKDAIEHAKRDHFVAPEIVAELQYRLGNLFVYDFHEGSIYGIEAAISYYEAALQVYEAERYPLQYAKTLTALGNAYGHDKSGLHLEQRVDNMVKALRCYEAALQACDTRRVHG
jgi:tetratricopeptide (TPR) repeat protein